MGSCSVTQRTKELVLCAQLMCSFAQVCSQARVIFNTASSEELLCRRWLCPSMGNQPSQRLYTARYLLEGTHTENSRLESKGNSSISIQRVESSESSESSISSESLKYLSLSLNISKQAIPSP